MNNYIDQNRDKFLNELLDLLRIPSVSADSKYKPDMLKAAEYVRDRMKEAGADRAEIFETPGHPVVYGEKTIDPNLPTVLIYGHYDVQPADPLDLWNSPPFEPVIKNDRIYARGACDDKGQFYMHIKALETMLATDSLTCNIKMMIEGEEEIGSSHLETFVKENRELLKCDTILISDTSIIANDVPSIETGLRGLTYVEVEVVGANRDLHSGVYGGGVANPINVLCEMIASLKDEDGHITIPGFYDKVQELSVDEREALNAAPFDLQDYKNDLQIDDVEGETGYTTIERTSVRPTLDVNGIWGGYIGEGAKTVLPSKANAKISMRLVPNQTDQEICELFSKHFESIAPASVKVKVTPHHGGLPYVTPTDSVEYEAAALAMEESFGKKPIPTRGGGSIPIVALFEQELGRKSILMGFGLDIDALHSPNESYGLFNYYKGIETIPLFFKHYAALKK
ncbi:dipeptidase [Dyadobacter psychrotolerans]|uniref:Dipeptidase n=1 Tax=Dyadobacter psychrotolerans TaxID=2541721 RepID=A0A4R5DB21_9BACT|nr:dipeptidase [Dyadobacter psychrotolerans]TDE10067.1 dipeptidase [Dyadobacter psychrotolerans]